MKKNVFLAASLALILLISGVGFASSDAGDLMAGDPVPEFEVLDLEGETVTNDIFADKDVTMINIWGTFCGPCINEMPELGELALTAPEGSQVIGLVMDISADDEASIETAQEIVEVTGADYPHLIIDEILYEYIYNVPGVPTTIFVDSEGNQLCEPIVGAMPGEEYRAQIEELLDEPG